MVIVTDPKNALYHVVEGAREKVEVDAADAGVLEINDADRDKIRNDAMLALESNDDHKKRARSEAEDLREIQHLNDTLHSDPYTLNKSLRAQMRLAKREDAALDEERVKLGLPSSIPLLPVEDSDRIEAQIAHLSKEGPSVRSMVSKQRQSIMEQSIFEHVVAGKRVVGGGGRLVPQQTAPPDLPSLIQPMVKLTSATRHASASEKLKEAALAICYGSRGYNKQQQINEALVQPSSSKASLKSKAEKLAKRARV